MAVLFITHKFPPSIGGMQRHSYELINGVKTHTKVYTIIQSPIEGKVYFFLTLPRRIKKMLRDHKDITAVHCNDGLVASFCSWLPSYTTVPVTATLHGLDIVFPNRIFQSWIVPRLHRFDKMYCVSEATREACLNKGFDPERLSVIPNGVDQNIKDISLDPTFAERLKQEHAIDLDKHKTLLSIGRAVRRKGFSWLAREVLPHLDDEYRYIIVGPKKKASNIWDKLLHWLPLSMSHHIALFLGYASDSRALNEQCQRSGSKLAHLGSLPYADLMQLMAQVDLVVIPNIKVEGDMEGFGLIALEAALRGTYVLGADIEGITCAIHHGQNGTLVASGESTIWVATIKSLLEDRQELISKGSRGCKYVMENFSWDKMATAYARSLLSLSPTRSKVQARAPSALSRSI